VQEKEVDTDQLTKRNGIKTGRRLSRKRRKQKMSEIKIIRLTTGEEVLCKAKKTKTGWIANKAALIIPTGQGSIGLMGWMPYTKSYEDGIEIKDEFVMFVSEPQEELYNEYNTAFGSGLIIAKESPTGSPLKLTT
jgi:hypothetical protein